jgi:capsular exopolysaccharide synthesis family protein
VTTTEEEIELGARTASYAGPGIFSILWRRKALVFFGLAAGVVAGLLFYVQKAPTYNSMAKLIVWQRKGDALSGNASTSQQSAMVNDYVATQEQLLTSVEVLKLAEKHLQNQTLRVPPPNNDYISFLSTGLKVSRQKDLATGASNNVLTVGFVGPSEYDSRVIVTAVIDGYKDWLKAAVADVTEDNFNLIVKSIKETDEMLAKNQDAFEEVRKDSRSLSQESSSDLKSRININETNKSALQIKVIEYDTMSTMINAAKREGKDPETIATLFRFAQQQKNSPLDQVKSPSDYIFQLDVKIDQLKEQMGDRHPEVLALQAQKKKWQEYLSQSTGGKGLEQPKNIDIVGLYLDYVAQQIKASKLQIEHIQHLIDEDRAAVVKLEAGSDKETRVKQVGDRLRHTLDEFTERKHRIDLTRDAPLYDARVITPPGVGVKVSPVLVTTLGVAAGIGLLLGCLLAYLAEASDKSFRSIDEVRQRLNVTVIGQVPPLTPHEPSVIEQNPLDPLLVVHHAPKSVQAEAYRGVRTSLYFSTRGKGHQVIQVTSPNPGDGKSTLTANLAAAIAQSGKKVILIDADFRKPRVHRIFGLGKAEIGLASVIAGEADLESAIYSCEVPGLSILPCGPRPANPADLLTSALFQEILEDIKKEYDFVLIDTPPMLAVSDPSVVAPRVDGVILTIRMTKNSRPMAEQAKERLTILGANLLGVVVNGMDDNNKGYGYGYGYGYEYAYGDDYQESSTKLNKPR